MSEFNFQNEADERLNEIAAALEVILSSEIEQPNDNA